MSVLRMVIWKSVSNVSHNQRHGGLLECLYYVSQLIAVMSGFTIEAFPPFKKYWLCNLWNRGTLSKSRRPYVCHGNTTWVCIEFTHRGHCIFRRWYMLYCYINNRQILSKEVKGYHWRVFFSCQDSNGIRPRYHIVMKGIYTMLL